MIDGSRFRPFRQWPPHLLEYWLFVTGAGGINLAPPPLVTEPYHETSHRFLHRFPRRPQGYDRPGNRRLETAAGKEPDRTGQAANLANQRLRLLPRYAQRRCPQGR